MCFPYNNLTENDWKIKIEVNFCPIKKDFNVNVFCSILFVKISFWITL